MKKLTSKFSVALGATFVALALVASACSGATTGSTTGKSTPTSSTVSCCGDTTTTAPKSERTTLRVVMAAEFTNLQPDIATQPSSRSVSSMIAEPLTLIDFDESGGSIVPGLAESWEQTDPTTWRFKLREGVTFTNGEPVTSEVVKNSHDIIKENGRGGWLVISGTTIEPVNDLEFDVKTEIENLASVPGKMNFMYLYPPAYYASVGAEGFGSHPIGTGPYIVEDFSPGQSLDLVANPDYWGGEPQIKNINIRTIAEDGTRLAELEAGSADLITDVPPALLDRARGLDGVTAKTITSQVRVFEMLNTAFAPLDDVRVRQAINHAIDRTAIIDGLFKGEAAPFDGVYVPGEFGSDLVLDPVVGYDYDPQRARDLLVEAGYPDGFEIPLTYVIGASVLDKETAEAVAGYLAEVGITAILNGGPSTTLADVIRDNNPGISQNLASGAFPDPSFIADIAYFGPNALYGEYAIDQKLWDIGAAALVEPDSMKRAQLYSEFQQYIHEMAFWVPMYVLKDTYAMAADVAWEPRPDKFFRFEGIGAS